MGRIARELRGHLLKGKRSQVVDFESVRKGRKEFDEIMQDVADHSPKDGEVDPLTKLYVDTTNTLGGILEMANMLMSRHFKAIAKKMERGRENYMPSYPPMSPLTKSYYTHWELYDMRFGQDQETIAEIFLHVGDILGFDEDSWAIPLKVLADTRMGIFELIKKEKKLCHFRELVTGEEFLAVSYSEYHEGRVGQLWYARRLPNIPGMKYDYSVINTTPYILLNSKDEWLTFFKENKVSKEGHYDFMKFGPKKNFWNEYIFYGYANFVAKAVFLTGLPERPKTLPCRENEFSEKEKYFWQILNEPTHPEWRTMSDKIFRDVSDGVFFSKLGVPPDSLQGFVIQRQLKHLASLRSEVLGSVGSS